MSYFGDDRGRMNDLVDNIDYFFKHGGTLEEFFKVLNYFFEDKELKK